MTNSNNILDKVIESQQQTKKAELNPRELIYFFTKDLNPREKEVISARYGLEKPEPQTLEAIGKRYAITRERVRQIEKAALKKILKTDGFDDKIKNLLSLVVPHIRKGGYLRREESLLDDLLVASREKPVDKNRLRFIFKYFLSDYIEPVEIIYTEPAWKLKDKKTDYYELIIEKIKKILERKNEPLHLQEIKSFLDQEIVKNDLEKIINDLESWEEALNSYLEISKHFGKNLFNKWGLTHWRSIQPKRMRDKIYLILQKYKKPMHFKTIAQRINDEKFDNKLAHPATIHNELILDERFVLVGRGIYALKEWGYKPGIILEVIKQVLAEKGVPLTKDEIIEEVLKRRMVKEGSVNLALSNRDVFVLLPDGRYYLKNSK